MNELGLPPLSAVEWSVIFGSLLLFSVVPTVLTWTEGLRERRAASLERAAALRALAPEEAVSAPDDLNPAVSEVLLAEEVEMQSEIVISHIEEQVAQEPATEEPAAAPGPVAAEEFADPAHEFRLDDLRRARVLETPRGDVLADPTRQQEWEEGLRLAEVHAADIGAAPLSASFEPQARSFAGMRDLGDTKEIRFLLFTALWPTSADQACGEALFELGRGGVVRAHVTRW